MPKDVTNAVNNSLNQRKVSYFEGKFVANKFKPMSTEGQLATLYIYYIIKGVMDGT